MISNLIFSKNKDIARRVRQLFCNKVGSKMFPLSHLTSVPALLTPWKRWARWDNWGQTPESAGNVTWQ